MEKFDLNDTSLISISLNEIIIIIENYLKIQNEPAIITTFNLDFFRIASKDIEFKKICNSSIFNLPDGFGITSLIWIKYNKKINRITGNDIFPRLLELANLNNFRIAIIGGSKKVSNKTKKKIVEDLKFNSENLLCLSPPFKFEQDPKINEQIIDEIEEFKPDIVFAALGCPRQEKWLYSNMKKFNSKINIGIGATLDFYSGEKKRSPIFLQRIGLEWLWRLLNEPARLFRRYIILDLPFYLRTLFKSKK